VCGSGNWHSARAEAGSQQLFNPLVLLFIYFAVLAFELGAYNLSHSTSSVFVLVTVFFEIGSCELFARAGFKT
jgi:hypothetical protein